MRPVSGAREGKVQRKIARIPDLNELASNHQQSEKESESEEVGEYYSEKPFDSEALKVAWDEFARQRKASGKDVEYAVLTQDFYLRDDHTIVLQLTNSVKIPILDRFRSDLITHLKSTLDNRHIQLETELLEEEQSYRPYTNREKFDYLAEKNPMLRTLQEKLGLDPDL